MMSQTQIVSALQAALKFGELSVIVRSPSAIAEVHGLLTVQQGTEWVKLGEEGRSHVHLKILEGCRLRYRQSEDKNTALELTGPDGEVLCRVVFQGTNPAKTDSYRSEHASKIRESFCWLTECGET